MSNVTTTKFTGEMTEQPFMTFSVTHVGESSLRLFDGRAEQTISVNFSLERTPPDLIQAVMDNMAGDIGRNVLDLNRAWPGIAAGVEHVGPEDDELRKLYDQVYGPPPIKVADDPEVIPITEQLRPEILPDVLPPWACEYAYALSEAKETPVGMATLLMLSAMASALQRRFIVHVEGSYHEPLMLYTAPAMESGERKTAIVKPTYGPLFDFQSQIRKDATAAAQAAKIIRELAESDLKDLKTKYRQASTEDRPALQQQIIDTEAKLPLLVKLPQIIVEDFTEASLGVFLADNHQSGLACSDEGGLFDNISGRHNDVSEIDLFLKAHVGMPHTVNRRIGSRLNIFSRITARLSVGISPQPSVLARFVDKPEFLSRGLVARFLWGLPTSKVGHRTLVARTVADHVRRTNSDSLMALAAQDRQFVGDPTPMQLSPAAYQMWKEFEAELEPRMGPDGDLRTIKAWASKLAGAVARIAGVCRAANFPHEAALNPIDGQQMALAVDLGHALIPHAIAVHRLMGGAGYTAHSLVVAHYDQNGWPAASQSLTEWWRPVRSIVGETSKAFEPVATKLVDHGYLILWTHPQRAGKKGQHFKSK